MKKETVDALKYWRNTLADAARIEIPIEKTVHLKDVIVDFNTGRIDQQQANNLMNDHEKRINSLRGIDDREHDDWESTDQVPILLALFSVTPTPEHSKFINEEGTFYPFWIRAIVRRSGELSIDDDTLPYIPRTFLEPQVNEHVNFTFSHVEKIDEVFASNFEGKDWNSYWKFIQTIFIEITNCEIPKYKTEDFSVVVLNTIVVNDTLPSAADGIIKLYDHLITSQPAIPLVETMSNPDLAKLDMLLTVEEFENASLSHLGQMGYEFPLSISQRKSLYQFNTLMEGDVIAVNGPPGTGKTTLLQSIVASEVVTSAIEGNEPRVILACSTNNQAVTNIIDSFSNVKTKNDLLYQRWLPRVTSFALYLPSSSKNVVQNVLYYKLGGGFPTDIENSKYIAEAKSQYIDLFNKFTGIGDFSIKEIIDYLRSKLIEKKESLSGGIQKWKAFKEVKNLIIKLGAKDELLIDQQLNINQRAILLLEEGIKEIESKVCDYLDNESIWIKLFAFIKSVREKRTSRLKQIFRDCQVDYSHVDFNKVSSVDYFFDTKLSVIKEILELNSLWINWKVSEGVVGNPPMSEEGLRTSDKGGKPFLYNELEVGIKNELFFLATHYWEGRWLVETESVVDNELQKKNGLVHAQHRWQRFAMLTPCFVSTFYMAPKFFTYSLFIKDSKTKIKFENPPLINFIDLLIVDEAGQVSPEVGMATFSLAKRSIVVGDVKQIEPIWSVPKKVDIANLSRYGLVSSTKDNKKIEQFLDYGFLGSSGSIMKLAQKSSRFHQSTKLERGMFLTEHRRCYDEIIEYCNKLAYHGLLQPLKGKAAKSPLKPMEFIAVDGDSISVGSSRANKNEAETIAKWLTENQARILKHYQSIEDAEAQSLNRSSKRILLSNIVGIITPFTGQKWILRSNLKKHGIDINGLTIGTVHALQGAERAVILFSSVYGRNNMGSQFFFDSGENMLNVAVSRAKDSFIMFGCEDLFKGEVSKIPSKMLYKHIRDLEKATHQQFYN